MEKLKFIYVFIFLLICSCSTDDDDFYDSEYYLEFNIGNERYRASSENLFLGGDYFESTNFYNFAENEIEFSTVDGGFIGGYLVLDDSLSEVEGIYSYLSDSYLSGDIFNVCLSGEESLNIQLNIIENDNQLNGTIKGDFEGFSVVEDWDNPCDYVGCCYEKVSVSGKFKLKITQ